MRTILIMVVRDFIGANLVHFLAEKYPLDRIIVLDALTYAGTIEKFLPPEMIHSHDARLRLWYGNVCNAALVDTLVEDADIVIHLAAETHVTRSIFYSLQFFQTDVLGTQTVRERGSEIRRTRSSDLSTFQVRKFMETPTRPP